MTAELVKELSGSLEFEDYTGYGWSSQKTNALDRRANGENRKTPDLQWHHRWFDFQGNNMFLRRVI